MAYRSRSSTASSIAVGIAVLFIIALVLAIWVALLIAIWSVNTLFKLNIEYSLLNWFAMFLLLALVKGASSSSSKKN